MNWFKHDTDALSDAKIKKLILRYGAEGYAIYFHCLELIASDINESNITFQLEHDAEIIADNLKIKGSTSQAGIDRVNEIMLFIVDLGLFDISGTNIFCFKLLKRLDQSMTSSPKMREMISSAKTNHDVIMTNHDFIMQDKNRIDKKRIEEKRENSAQGAPARPESIEEVKQYFEELGNIKEAENFFDYFESNGWKVGGKAVMKNWKASARNWIRRSTEFRSGTKKETAAEKLKRWGLDDDE